MSGPSQGSFAATPLAAQATQLTYRVGGSGGGKPPRFAAGGNGGGKPPSAITCVLPCAGVAEVSFCFNENATKTTNTANTNVKI